MQRDIRLATKFILRVNGVYTESEIMRKDYLTFFRMLDEAEIEEKENIARMEKQNAKIHGWEV